MSQFVHLHLHTDYSMLDGACDVEKLVHARERAGHARGRHDRPRQHFRRRAFRERGQEGGRQADRRLRALRLQERRPQHRAHSARRRHLQPPAGAGRKRRRLPQPGQDHVRGLAAWFLLQAARQQEISGGALQGTDRTLRLPERRSRRAPDGREVRRRARRGCHLSATSSARTTSSSKFRTRAWSRNTASTPTCSAWKKILACRWWPPTTATTSARTTRTRRT